MQQLIYALICSSTLAKNYALSIENSGTAADGDKISCLENYETIQDFVTAILVNNENNDAVRNKHIVSDIF